MEKTTKENLVDVSRLYTLRRYSESFDIAYATIYSKYMSTLAKRNKNPFILVNVSGIDMIYVSAENEKKLLQKSKKKGVTV